MLLRSGSAVAILSELAAHVLNKCGQWGGVRNRNHDASCASMTPRTGQDLNFALKKDDENVKKTQLQI